MQAVGHAAEAFAAWLLYYCFALLPVDAASALGGWVGRTFGSTLSVSNNARRNLRNIYPDWTDEKIETVVVAMWDNLGRTAGEHPHLSKFNPFHKNSRVEVVGFDNCEKLMESDKPCLFFSGHLANWELVPMVATGRGLVVHLIYRRANNPFFDKLIQKGRNILDSNWYPKGADGARAILKALKNGDNLAMLVDQKMNDGIAAPFLGKDAMTAPALAELAIRFNCPVLPAHVERLEGAYFRVTFYPPLQVKITGNKKKDTFNIMRDVNQHLGKWVNENPGQWLWVHNRWPN